MFSGGAVSKVLRRSSQDEIGRIKEEYFPDDENAWQRKPVKSGLESHFSKRNLGRVAFFVSINIRSGYRYKSAPMIMLRTAAE